MRSVRDLFGDLCAALEDTHAIASDGMGPDCSPDMHRALLAHVRIGLDQVETIVGRIGKALSGPK